MVGTLEMYLSVCACATAGVLRVNRDACIIAATACSRNECMHAREMDACGAACRALCATPGALSVNRDAYACA
jgi:hypothetical protein